MTSLRDPNAFTPHFALDIILRSLSYPHTKIMNMEQGLSSVHPEGPGVCEAIGYQRPFGPGLYHGRLTMLRE